MHSRDDAQAMYDTAIRVTTWLWRAGCWTRAALLAGMWVTLAWADPAERWRGAAQLSVGSLAIVLAFAHTSKGALGRIRALRLIRRLADHLMTTEGRATIDASGIAEGAGVLLATWLYVGWFPLAGLPPVVRTIGLCLAIAYVWNAVLQAVIDAGWYNVKTSPHRGMAVFRRFIPLIHAGLVTFVLWPWSPHVLEVPLSVRVFLSASPLLYYPVWVVFDLMLRASAAQLAIGIARFRSEVAADVHSAVKNPLGFLISYLNSPDPDIDEIRTLTRNASVFVDKLREDIAEVRSSDRHPGEVQDLWWYVQRAFPPDRRHTCSLTEGSGEVRLSSTDYQLAQIIILDLVSNAMAAGGERITVTCSAAGPPDGRVEISVTDDGIANGLGKVDFRRKGSSLDGLAQLLAHRGGRLSHDVGPGMTVARASWLTDTDD